MNKSDQCEELECFNHAQWHEQSELVDRFIVSITVVNLYYTGPRKTLSITENQRAQTVGLDHWILPAQRSVSDITLHAAPRCQLLCVPVTVRTAVWGSSEWSGVCPR